MLPKADRIRLMHGLDAARCPNGQYAFFTL